MSPSAASPRRPSPAVYRRRRLVALVALLVVLALLVWGVVAAVGLVKGLTGGSEDPGTGTTTSAPPTSGADAGASGSSATAEPTECRAGDVVVKASTDATAYAPEVLPVLIMTVENTGQFDCEVNLGTGEQEFLVMSGEDRIFSTKDCAADPADLRLTMKPGQSETARFTWERLRSAPGCQTVAANPRPGTYWFQAKLGNRESNRAVFTLQ